MAYLNMEYFVKYVLLGPTADDVNIYKGCVLF